MKRYTILAFLSVILLLASCKTSKLYFENEDWLNEQAKELYGSYNLKYNDNSTLVLVTSSNQESNNPNFKLKFSILDLANKQLLLQREMDNTIVSWYSSNKLLAVTQLGFVDKKTGVSQKRQIINVFSE